MIYPGLCAQATIVNWQAWERERRVSERALQYKFRPLDGRLLHTVLSNRPARARKALASLLSATPNCKGEKWTARSSNLGSE